MRLIVNIFISLWCCCWATISFAANTDSIKNNYPKAAADLEQQIYAATNSITRNQLLLAKSNCLKENGCYTEAVKNLNRIDFDKQPDSIVYRVLYESALMSYLTNNFTEADYFLTQMKNELLDSNYTNQCLLLQSLCSLQKEDWEAAVLFSKKYLQQNHLETKKFDSLWHADFPHFKNLKKASALSAIVPGLGNFYAHNYKMGLLNMASMATVVGLVALHVYWGYYFVAGISGVGLVIRFYTGGIKTARQSAEHYNQKAATRFKKNITDYLTTH